METKNEELIDGIAESKMRLFLGDNADYYLDKWKASDDPKKKAGWNWARCLSRKLSHLIKNFFEYSPAKTLISSSVD